MDPGDWSPLAIPRNNTWYCARVRAIPPHGRRPRDTLRAIQTLRANLPEVLFSRPRCCAQPQGSPPLLVSLVPRETSTGGGRATDHHASIPGLPSVGSRASRRHDPPTTNGGHSDCFFTRYRSRFHVERHSDDRFHLNTRADDLSRGRRTPPRFNAIISTESAMATDRRGRCCRHRQ